MLSGAVSRPKSLIAGFKSDKLLIKFLGILGHELALTFLMVDFGGVNTDAAHLHPAIQEDGLSVANEPDPMVERERERNGSCREIRIMKYGLVLITPFILNISE